MRIFVLNGHGTTLPNFFLPSENIHIQPIVCMDDTVNVKNVSPNFYSKPVEVVYRDHINKARLPVTMKSTNYPQYKIPQKYHRDAFFHDMKISLFPFYYSKRDPRHAIMFKIGLYELPVFPETIPQGVGTFEKDFFFDPSLDTFHMEGNVVKDHKSMMSHVRKPLTVWNRTKRKDISFIPVISSAIKWASRHSIRIPPTLFTPHRQYVTGIIKQKYAGDRTYILALDPTPTTPTPDARVIQDTDIADCLVLNESDFNVRLKKKQSFHLGDRVVIEYKNRTDLLLSDIVLWLGTKYPDEPIYIYLFTCRAISEQATFSDKTLLSRLQPQRFSEKNETHKKRKMGFQQMTNIKINRRALESLYNIIIQIENLYDILLKKNPSGILSWFTPPKKYEPHLQTVHKNMKDTLSHMGTIIADINNRQQVFMNTRIYKNICNWIQLLSPYDLSTPDMKKFYDLYCMEDSPAKTKRRKFVIV